MKVVMYSNYLNHHQLPLCQALNRLTEGNFTFVATTPVPKERLQFGYQDMNSAHPFVLRTYESSAQKALAQQLALEADVVIHGSAPWGFLQPRLGAKKLTFLYSERLYKSGYQHWKWPLRMWRFYRKYGRHRCLHLLCASAYTAYDFARTRTFLRKAYRWGYFPEVKQYEDFQQLMTDKKANSILWAGRFISWKHPEQVIEVARRLKAEGIPFSVTMLGNGPLLEQCRQMVQDYELQDYVNLPGAVSAEEVRVRMEAAQIYLFTSDRGEGWGAVLSESMNSGCAVVACRAIGSVPFLLQDGQNGCTYGSGDVEELYQQVKHLLENPAQCHAMGQRAYDTMTSRWNGDVAAQRLLQLSNALLAGEKQPALYTDGPCSLIRWSDRRKMKRA